MCTVIATIFVSLFQAIDKACCKYLSAQRHQLGTLSLCQNPQAPYPVDSHLMEHDVSLFRTLLFILLLDFHSL
jgi:hypothetical protein